MPDASRARTDLEGVASGEPAITSILTAFRTVLERPDYGVDDSFFGLGITSLEGLQVAHQLRRQFGMRVTLADLYSHPTPRQLADYMATAGAGVVAVGRRSVRAVANRRRGQGYPISLSQEPFFRMDRAVQGFGAFASVGRLDLVGDVDPNALVGAIRDVVAHHEVLRTVFDDAGVLPTQRVTDEPARIAVRDLRAPGTVERLCRREALRRFDLGEEPPAHFTVARVADDAWCVVSSIHHVAFDGVSRQNLAEDLATSYAARVTCAEPSMKQTGRYVEFAEWQRDTLRGARLEEHLQGLAESLTEPAGRLGTEPAGDVNYLVCTEALSVRTDMAEGLSAAAASAQASLASTVAAGLLQACARLTGRRRQAVSIQVANRNWPGSESMIGCFSNVLPVAVAIEPSEAPDHLIRTVHAAIGRALRHEEVPLDHALAILRERAGRLSARDVLPDVGFVMQPRPSAGYELPGCVLRTATVDELGEAVDPTTFALVLETWLEDDSLRGITRRLIGSWPGGSFRALETELMKSWRLLAGFEGVGA